ncbi:MAG: hypothetical protein ACSLFN_07865 [Candidatus Limnocylindrales bacterium]
MTRPPSRTEVTGRTRRARIARSLGPEVVAGLASVVAVALIATLVIRQPGPVAPTPTGSAPTSLAPSDAPPTAVNGSPTTRASPDRTAASWAAQATVLMGAEQRLAEIRARLATALAEVPPSTTAIARELRAMNTTLTGALDAIASMASNGAPSALVDDLRSAHEAALGVSLETLQASVQNAPAYQAGAAEVVADLDEISILARRARAEAGLPSAAP